MKITQGFDVNQDGKDDIYITRNTPDAKTGCLMMALLPVVLLLLFFIAKLGDPDFRSDWAKAHSDIQKQNDQYVPPKPVPPITATDVFFGLAIFGGLLLAGAFAWAMSPGDSPGAVEPSAITSLDLTSVSLGEARDLATQHGTLRLRLLEQLPADVAAELAKHKGGLQLPGLTQISSAVATELAKHNGPLGLRGLTAISPEVAKALSRHRGDLLLSGIVSLSDEAAEVLSRHEGTLWLDGLKRVSKRAEASLRKRGNARLPSKWSQQRSVDDDFSRDDEDVFDVFSEDRSELTACSHEAFMRFAGLDGDISLNHLTSLSDEDTAKALAGCGEWLELNGLTTISHGAAKALATHGGFLELSGLTAISEDVAKALSQNMGSLALRGLATLSDEAAKALAKYRGQSLYLDGLNTLSDEAAKSLRANSSIKLPEKFRRRKQV